MRRRHPVPRQWLMTDDRMGDAMWDALERLPRGSGVVFRHYHAPDRQAVLTEVAKIVRRRQLVLLAAGGLAGLHGVHNGRGRGRGLASRSAHSRREAVAAQRAGADLIFVSPVHPTRSHAGARGLGRVRFGLMIRDLRVPVIALGGMDARRMHALKPLGAHGWAGIDAWLGRGRAKPSRQKRKAVPT